jgi:hypothetical protein
MYDPAVGAEDGEGACRLAIEARGQAGEDERHAEHERRPDDGNQEASPTPLEVAKSRHPHAATSTPTERR